MRALLHHMPFEKSDTTREYRLEVSIGGEVYWQSIILSAMEVKHSPHVSLTIKSQLVGRFLDELKAEIREQIGRV